MNDKQIKRIREIVPGRLNSVAVVDGDITRAIRNFKKRVKDSGVIQELYDRREFQKNSLIRRKQRQSAEYKQRKSDERQ